MRELDIDILRIDISLMRSVKYRHVLLQNDARCAVNQNTALA